MKYKLQFLLTLIFLVSSTLTLRSQGIPDDSLYLGQTSPGAIPKIFAPGIVCLANRHENVITFSPDGKQVFFSIDDWPNKKSMFMEYKNDKWTTPEIASFSQDRSVDECFFSLDGKRVYYYAYNAPNLVGGSDICYSEKQDTGWSDPINLGTPLNTSIDEYHPCIVADSSIYFDAKDGEICYSQYKNGAYQARIILPYPINYANTIKTWGDPYVSPDESYMLLASTRSGGYGDNDLYICYRKNDGSWTNPKNLGSTINTSAGEGSADITPDGKYMTFNRTVNDIYWVSSNFIDSLRHTNFIPYVKRTIPSKTAIKDSLFTYQIPDNTFIDDDGNNTLRYTATLSNGTPLPLWLSLDSVTCTFSGIPDTAAMFNIKVKATDTAGASVLSALFSITVTSSTGIGENKGKLPKNFYLYQNYPNPFNPSTMIRYSMSKPSQIKLTVYNLLGQKVKTLIDSNQNAGEYSTVWDARDEKKNPVSSGVYFYNLEAGSLNLQKKMVLLK